MHYKNGREAKPGDIAVNTVSKQSGVLHSVNGGSTTCNGRLATMTQNDPYVNIGDCLHIDDIAAAATVIPDLTKPLVDDVVEAKVAAALSDSGTAVTSASVAS